MTRAETGAAGTAHFKPGGSYRWDAPDDQHSRVNEADLTAPRNAPEIVGAQPPAKQSWRGPCWFRLLPISDAGQLGRDTAGQAVADSDPGALDCRGLERMDGHIGLCACVRGACEMTKAAT